MCSTKLSEKDYRKCMQAIAWCMSSVQELKERYPLLQFKDVDIFTGIKTKEVEDLILRLSNNAEIAWLQDQKDVIKDDTS